MSPRETRSAAWVPRATGRVLTMTALAALAGATQVGCRSADPHAIYETRCATCHAPHAGELAQEMLGEEDGKAIVVRTRQPLAEFVATHPRRNPLTSEDAMVLTAHLTTIVRSGFVFRKKCFACHERARQLSTDDVVERDGTLHGRVSGRELEMFLRTHADLTEEERGTIMRMIRRQRERR